ncbi:MAG: hypothetical protein ACOY3J_06460 [Bacillota bacterium]|uniref:Uncharacterized protein n=1 Tax=Thermanaerosceptrum fracticalcis TaxID=1712410 RepID=A0A7G6E179_THEFR|nr:hypothetical protein [Thermanaerosceptrum fracticalcis]QNB45833.1 hypothetical protein BR63_05600 [Thermanaerosceptrum fracticalcis]
MTEHVCKQERLLGEHDRAIEDLMDYKKAQNGAIHRLEDKVDRLQYWVMGGVAAMALQFLLLLLKR